MTDKNENIPINDNTNPLDGGLLDNIQEEESKNKEENPFSTILVRAITGAVYVLIVVGTALFSPGAFNLFFMLITGLATWEFCTIVNVGLRIQVNRLITTICAVMLYYAMFETVTCLAGLGVKVFYPFIITLMYILISELYMKGFRKIENWAFSFMAILYIALPISLLPLLEFIPINGGLGYTCTITLSLFIFLWTSDTGAYVIGSKFGKHRLFPSVSPKKSWEGTIGGGVLAIIASQIIVSFLNLDNGHSVFVNRLIWAGFALIVVVFGTWGDLVESRLKRKLGVKDSGNILPGHGGWLDRFDSAILAIPAAFIYLSLIA